MRDLDTCIIDGCGKPKHSFYDGRPLCRDHYQETFSREMHERYEEWSPDATPPDRFVYLLGRFYEEFAQVTGEGYLSPARIRDRGFSFHKTAEGCRFSITRHLNAWSETKQMRRVVQDWEFVWEHNLFRQLVQREWQVGDPE